MFETGWETVAKKGPSKPKADDGWTTATSSRGGSKGLTRYVVICSINNLSLSLY